jgi:hypothetical protein
MRRYIIIVSPRNRKVIMILESPPVDENNMWDISESLSIQWLESSTKYPSPQYDIITGAWADQSTAQKSVGQYWDWESAPIIPLSV